MIVDDQARSGPKFSCLIVEDDLAFAELAGAVVKEEGGEPSVAADIAGAQSLLQTRSFDLILLDNHLPDGKGYDLFKILSRSNSETPIIMITGVPDLSEAVALTRNGLFDYLTKPVDVEKMAACLRRAKLRLAAHSEIGAGEWLGESAPMAEVMTRLRQAARHASATVLLTGETGVGKDLAARMLHQLSFPGGSAPFVPVNCAAIPGDMFESELFGAERGAYTGAEKRRTGLAGAASDGTLFLDEIAEVPLALQPKLLRLLEERQYRTLGSTETLRFSGRVVAATNKSLDQEVKAGRFREDLFFRLEVFCIEIPPLRRRREDIPKLAEILLAQLACKYERKKPQIAHADMSALIAHSFPGNVRELRNVLERSLLKTPEENKWLAPDWNWLASHSPGRTQLPTDRTQGPVINRQLSTIEAQEYQLIRDSLRQNQGGIRRTAAKLGMSPQSLLRRLEKWPELREGTQRAAE